MVLDQIVALKKTLDASIASARSELRRNKDLSEALGRYIAESAGPHRTGKGAKKRRRVLASSDEEETFSSSDDRENTPVDSLDGFVVLDDEEHPGGAEEEDEEEDAVWSDMLRPEDIRVEDDEFVSMCLHAENIPQKHNCDWGARKRDPSIYIDMTRGDKYGTQLHDYEHITYSLPGERVRDHRMAVLAWKEASLDISVYVGTVRGVYYFGRFRASDAPDDDTVVRLVRNTV